MTNGAYFTTNRTLLKCVSWFVLNNPKVILEPSIGRGDIVNFIKENHPYEIHFDMFEIDSSIPLLDLIQRDQVVYTDFLEYSFPNDRKYTTIIGNPPFVRTKKGNLYIDFVRKCFTLLEENGELIFIVPSDFLKLTSAVTVLKQLMSHGSFTHIYQPNDEQLFDGASIDVIVFRYCKNPNLKKKVLYIERSYTNRTDLDIRSKFIRNSNGLITFTENANTGTPLKEYFEIHVGLVSGKESIFKNMRLGNISVQKDYGMEGTQRYIFVKTYPTANEELNRYLLENKEELLKRKIKKFDESNWFEWGAPRNICFMEHCKGEECIYIKNLTRSHSVAFKGRIQYFGATLIALKPKNPSLTNLDTFVTFLNSTRFRKNFTYAGRFKIGQRQLENSLFL